MGQRIAKREMGSVKRMQRRQENEKPLSRCCSTITRGTSGKLCLLIQRNRRRTQYNKWTRIFSSFRNVNNSLEEEWSHTRNDESFLSLQLRQPSLQTETNRKVREETWNYFNFTHALAASHKSSVIFSCILLVLHTFLWSRTHISIHLSLERGWHQAKLSADISKRNTSYATELFFSRNEPVLHLYVSIKRMKNCTRVRGVNQPMILGMRISGDLMVTQW